MHWSAVKFVLQQSMSHPLVHACTLTFHWEKDQHLYSPTFENELLWRVWAFCLHNFNGVGFSVCILSMGSYCLVLYCIDRCIYLNLSKSTQSAAGLKALKPAVNGRYWPINQLRDQPRVARGAGGVDYPMVHCTLFTYMHATIVLLAPHPTGGLCRTGCSILVRSKKRKTDCWEHVHRVKWQVSVEENRHDGTNRYANRTRTSAATSLAKQWQTIPQSNPVEHKKWYQITAIRREPRKLCKKSG